MSIIYRIRSSVSFPVFTGTFQEGTHVSYGVRYRALPKSVKFEAKGKIVDGIGTLLKVDEAQGQYGFIKVCYSCSYRRFC